MTCVWIRNTFTGQTTYVKCRDRNTADAILANYEHVTGRTAFLA